MPCSTFSTTKGNQTMSNFRDLPPLRKHISAALSIDYHRIDKVEFFDTADKTVLLTRSNMRMLECHGYMVTPKAVGTRKILACHSPTGQVALLNPSKDFETEILLESNTNCPVKGFALDVVEVPITKTGERHFLAFNIRALHKGCHRFKVDKFHKMTEKLQYFVRELSLPHLSVKQYWSIYEARTLWELSKKLPYPVDGLIYTPEDFYRNHVSYKWKPADRLTMNVALGEPTSKTSDGSNFVPHLKCMKFSKTYSLARLIRELEFGKNTRSNDSFFRNGNCIKTHSLPFQLTAKRQTRTNKRRWQLSRHFDTLNMNLNTNISTVIKVKESADSSSQRQQQNHSQRDGNRETNSEQACSLFVPHPYDEWASHQVVKIQIDIVSGNLVFKSIQRGKIEEDSFEMVQNVLDLVSHPLPLNEIRVPPRVFAPLRRGTRTYRKGPIPKGKKKPSTSTKRKLSQCTHKSPDELSTLHCFVNGFLCKAFGGRNIIETCFDANTDLQKWNESGCSTVVCFNNDLKSKRKSTRNKDEDDLKIDVTFLRLDLTTNVRDDLKNVDLSDAVFSNFAVQNFAKSEVITQTFLDNLVPMLKEGGRFIITFMKEGEESEDSSSEEEPPDLAPVGKRDGENNFINSDDLISRFQRHQLHYSASYPFEVLGRMHPSLMGRLNPQERKAFSLYHVAIFEKSTRLKKGKSEETQDAAHISLLSLNNLPESLLLNIFSFLSIEELAKVREVSKGWWRSINEVADNHSSCFFQDKKKPTLFYEEDETTDDIACDWFYRAAIIDGEEAYNCIDMSTFPIASYVRFGGCFEPMPEAQVSDSDSTIDSADSLNSDSDDNESDDSTLFPLDYASAYYYVPDPYDSD